MQKTVIFLSVVLLLAMAAMGAYIWQNEQDKKALIEQLNNAIQPTSTPVLTSPETPEPEQPSTESAVQTATGTITGSISFPSEVIPPMEVCAEDIATKEQICSDQMLKDPKYQYGVGYEITVPAGEYHVFATLPNDPYQAYYNEFVKCGLKATCTSHEPVSVKVSAGQTITNIDPQDWYNRPVGQ